VKQKETWDIIIVGGGHAGVESALISNFKRCRVLVITMDKNAIGRMSCNPAIGGLAKGQMVREIDVLGGAMASFADKTGIQFKTLNKTKGRAVWSPRAQIDKRFYEKTVLETFKENLITVVEGEVVSVETKNGSVSSVFLRSGERITTKAVILTSGTFLSGIIHIGQRKILAGRMGEERAEGLTESLCSLGFKSGRLKTGTPPRLDKSSIDWNKTKIELGDETPMPFSYSTGEFKPKNEACHSVNTNQNVHDIIEKNKEKSPMFSGDIGGVGPRYCPSIEDKIHRFSDRKSHGLFLEPEWEGSDQIYLNGFSTSLPEETQIKALKQIPGFENVQLFRPGYAIEYDFFPPSQLKNTLETKDVNGLFFAGQMNGTSGYEEAAAQGLVAGINAVSYVKGEEPLILDRSSSYIGVMIDDLITKDTLEPYRMFTSRAEYRLMLRISNTCERLHGLSKKHKLINEKKLSIFENFLTNKQNILNLLNKSIKPEDLMDKKLIKQKTPAKIVVRRPDFSIFDLPSFFYTFKSALPVWLKNDLLFDVESEVKYEGYIKRHLREIEKFKKNELVPISKKTIYSDIPGLSKEAVEKFSIVRPETLGQAGRISGVKPSDTTVLMINLLR
jgi:tRNA uridine 5-carboxymethylaminomethyl modification enzyme